MGTLEGVVPPHLAILLMAPYTFHGAPNSDMTDQRLVHVPSLLITLHLFGSRPPRGWFYGGT